MNMKFGDCVLDTKGKVDRNDNPYDYYIAGDHMDSEDLELHRKGCFATDDVGPAFIRTFKPGQVLYGSRRTYLKKVAVADFEGVTANTTFVFETKDPSVLCQDLLPFIMWSDKFTNYSILKSKGSTNPYVLYSDLAEYEFELPDLAKQQELAELLWSMEYTKRAYRKLIAQTDELVKSQFIEMFGTPESVMDSAHTIAEVADVQVGIVIKPTRFYDDGNNGIKAFRSLNIGPMCIKDDDWVYFTEDAMKETQRTIAHTDDILVVRSGNPGTSCVVPPEYDGCNVIDLIIAHPNKEKVLPEYLSAFTNMPHGMNQINSQQRGVAQKHFNVGMYKDLKLILPSLDKQKQFVDFLKQSDKSKFELQRALDELTAMQKKIINQNLS